MWKKTFKDISNFRNQNLDQLYVGSFPSILIAGLQDKQQQIIYRTCNPEIPLEEVKTRIEMGKSEKSLKKLTFLYVRKIIVDKLI